MAAVLDTNVLVYAHREEMPEHSAAVALLRSLSTGPEPVGLPWPCVYEFLRVVTHARVFGIPSRLSDAWAFVGDLIAMPSMLLLAETERHADVLAEILVDAAPAGNLVHDAHIAALALEHGFSEVITNDRDFRRFPRLTMRLLGP